MIEDKRMTRVQGRNPLTGSLLTVAEVAAVLRVSNMTIYRLIKAGDVPALRVGKNYRIRSADLDAFLASGTVAVDTADRSNG